MRKIGWIIFMLILYRPVTFAQTSPVDRQLFFLDDKVIEVTLTTDIKKLRNEKKVPAWQPANATMTFADSSVINEEIRIEPRGIFRKNYCDLASLMINFKSPSSPKLSPLKKLKLVGGCRNGNMFEELLLKEYLVYKIYNLLSIMSFKVRLLHVNYKDIKQKAKPYSQYAFLIEDMNDLTKRNNCKEIKHKVFAPYGANRRQMTVVSLFQYMIGNTDWSIRNYHNMKLMAPKNDTLANPYAIPYDFDYAGIVDAPYATPNEELPITSVRDRLYRGFDRSMEELHDALEIFKEKKGAIMLTINNFTLLSERTRKEMVRYLEGFYDTIDNDRSIRNAFISNARTL